MQVEACVKHDRCQQNGAFVQVTKRYPLLAGKGHPLLVSSRLGNEALGRIQFPHSRAQPAQPHLPAACVRMCVGGVYRPHFPRWWRVGSDLEGWEGAVPEPLLEALFIQFFPPSSKADLILLPHVLSEGAYL